MARLVALGGVLGISFAAIFVRLADTAPTTASFFRTAYALPVIAGAWWIIRHRDERPPRDRLLAFGSGLILAADLTFFHIAIGAIGAGLATLLANTQVVFVGVTAWLVLGERPTRTALASVPAVLLGVAFVSGLGRPDAYGEAPLIGVIFGLMAGMAYAAFLLLFRQSNRVLAPTPGPLLDATAGAAVGALIAGLFDPGFSLAPAWPAHGWLLALAIVAQAAGWMLIAFALPRLPALTTSVLILLQPVATFVWAFLIFRERLSVVQVSGSLLVLAGIAAVTAAGTVQVRSAAGP